MPQLPSRAGPTRRRISVTGIVTTLGGLALLVYVVSRVGLTQIATDVRQVGWGLLAIIAIGGLRFLARAIAWQICLEGPARLPVGSAFAAVVCGDAIGNLTPFGPLVGEPAKAAFVRTRVPLGPAATALAIENVLYTLSAAAMIAAGMIALLFRFQLPTALRNVGEFAIAGTVALFAVALLLMWRQPALISRALGVSPRLQHHGERARLLEEQVYSFASRRRAALPALVCLEAAFHALGVAEVHLTLWLFYGAPPALLTSFIFEATNRLITVVFKFVPLRLGVDEAATALFSQVLGLGANTGVSLSIVRKARVLFWTAVGGLLLVREGVAIRMNVSPEDESGQR
jgi:lysylphosphatidylglycerol synthase-like protein